MNQLNQLHVRWTTTVACLRDRLGDDRGEGVISTALAVLIVAFLGVAAFALFDQLVQDSGTAAGEHIKQYGG